MNPNQPDPSNTTGQNAAAAAASMPATVSGAAVTRPSEVIEMTDDMTDDEFAATAAAHDARAMAAMSSGGVAVHTDLDEFVRVVETAQREKARQDSDPRTNDQIRADVGVLLQRFYDARWYGTSDDIRHTVSELGQALREMRYRIYTPAAAVQPGDYIRAVGRDPDTGEPTSASGIVDEATYTSRPEPGRSNGEQLGFRFVVVPPQRNGHHTTAYEVFVDEDTRLIRLSAPVDRGRPAWLAPSATTAHIPGPAGDRLAPAAGRPPGSADTTTMHASTSGAARPFPPPDRIDPTTSSPAPPPPPDESGPGRHR